MPDDLRALDTSTLKRLADRLRMQLRDAEAELWRRSATRLATLPPGWSDPAALGLLLSGDAAEGYEERAYGCLVRALPFGCRLNRAYPATEIWGPRGAMGPNPTHGLRELLTHMYEQLRDELTDSEPWR